MSGENISGAQRLKALSATNTFFSNRNCLVLFDEIEEAFEQGDADSQDWFRPKRQRHNRGSKGFVNRLLETNKLPTIWIGNSLREIDSAFIRRFDVVLQMPIPPHSQRERIIRKASAGMLDEATIRRMAKSEALAPALITRSVKVVGEIATQLGDSTELAKAVELLINQTLKAQDHRTIPRSAGRDLPDFYDPAFINSSINLTTLAQQLQSTKTEVNEMLTQMESFNGLFVASTNLMQGLDSASLRRFDLKLKFDYLRHDQALKLLTRYTSQLNLSAPSSQDQRQLAELSLLTPGDFAVVVRQNWLIPLHSAAEFIVALAQECAIKSEKHGRAIGFV